MDIGSLFINLGIKGSEKTLEQVSNVKKGIGDVASTSLEAKAAIVGAMYALEQLFATSGRAGTELTNFNALTGVSVQTLQQYQYAARQVGVSNEAVASTFKTLQDQMTNAAFLGKGGPAGMAHVAQVLHENFSQVDIQKFAKSPQLLLQKLQEYAAKETNIGLRNATLKSFGLGDEMVAALTRQAFSPQVLKRAPTYSDNEVKALDKANIAWSNLGNKIAMAVGHFNAMHGGQLVNDISKLVTVVFRLADAFVKLAEKLHVFQGIGKVFGVVATGLEDISKRVSLATGDKKGLLHGAVTQGGHLLGDLFNEGKADVLKYGPSLVKQGRDLIPSQKEASSWFSGLKNDFTKMITPSVSKAVSNNNTQNHDVSITNNFSHGGVDVKQTVHDIKKSFNQFFRNNSAQSQGA